MGFAWSEDLRTGIAGIDAQHKTLIGQINDLLAACSQKKGSREVQKFLIFLTGYVHRHFDDEEREMERSAYTGLARHRGEHEKYRRKLAELKDQLATSEDVDRAAEEALWLAAEWFVDHIRTVDIAMAAAIRSGKR